MHALTGVIALLVVTAVVAVLARGGVRGTAQPAAAPADPTGSDGQRQLQQEFERSLQQGADKALQSGY